MKAFHYQLSKFPDLYKAYQTYFTILMPRFKSIITYWPFPDLFMILAEVDSN